MNKKKSDSKDNKASVKKKKSPSLKQLSESLELEKEKYGFTITVTDPKQNISNLKFKESDMTFFSYAKRNGYVENKKGYLRIYPYYYDDDKS